MSERALPRHCPGKALPPAGCAGQPACSQRAACERRNNRVRGKPSPCNKGPSTFAAHLESRICHPLPWEIRLSLRAERVHLVAARPRQASYPRSSPAHAERDARLGVLSSIIPKPNAGRAPTWHLTRASVQPVRVGRTARHSHGLITSCLHAPPRLRPVSLHRDRLCGPA